MNGGMVCVDQVKASGLVNYPSNNQRAFITTVHTAVIIVRERKPTPSFVHKIHRATAGSTLSILQQQEPWVTMTAAVMLVGVVSCIFIQEAIHWTVCSDSYVISEKEGDRKTWMNLDFS